MLIYLVFLVLIYLWDCKFLYTAHTSKMDRLITAGAPLSPSKLIFLKAQKINIDIFKAESPRDFWIADFMYSMANLLLQSGINNSTKDFPLIDNRVIVKNVIQGMKVFLDPDVDTKVDETLNIINMKPDNPELQDPGSMVRMTDCVVHQYQSQYPSIDRESIVNLLYRYGSMCTYTEEYRDICISKTCLSIPPALYYFYNKTLPNTIETFASPVNHTLDRFCALFKEDEEFGAIGPFSEDLIKANIGSSFIINPPYDSITMNLVSSIVHEHVFNNYSICLPSKDGGLFHLYKGRSYHFRDGDTPMHPSIRTLLSIKTLSGILVIPADIMHYWSYFKQKRQRIGYDTIILFYLTGKTREESMEYLQTVRDIIVKFGYGNDYRGKRRIYNIPSRQIMDEFPITGRSIIDSLKINF